ncbi:MAG: aspartate-semialdehyde dehydrogenase [Thermoproteota archaeon]|jgi:aspartate semialdehyde dehydrogenase (EC 1.2.1.11)
MGKIKAGILGATGLVGQTFIYLLKDHPWFEITEVAASEKSSHKTYYEAVLGRWRFSSDIPDNVKNLEVKECKPKLDCDIVFSALDASIAREIEEDFAKNGYGVLSNASSHRMDEDVPLVIPEINPEHLELLDVQKRNRKWDGFIVTNANCTTTHLVLTLKPIHDEFGLEKVFVTSMQALSGAGYPGVASLDIIDNVIPFIRNEEQKVETETLKILGKFKNNKIEMANIAISAHCNRVNVRDGHTECVSVKLSSNVTIDDLINAFERFNPLKEYKLPMAPSKPIVIKKEEDRPQPRLDREIEKGMASVIGRIRKCNVLDYKYVVLGHNLIRGAAGAAILNAEYMYYKGYFREYL